MYKSFDTDRSGVTTLHHTKFYSLAVTECQCNTYPGMKYTLKEKMRGTIMKSVFCDITKGNDWPMSHYGKTSNVRKVLKRILQESNGKFAVRLRNVY